MTSTDTNNETPLTADEARDSVAAYLAEHGITYTAVFVPQSASRNSADKNPTLNWRVTFTGNGRALSTDYSQGIGHVPGYCQSRATYDHKCLQYDQHKAAESGQYPARASGTKQSSTDEKGNYIPPKTLWKPATSDTYRINKFGIKFRPLPAPDAADVLHSLLLDASVTYATCFEDWASEYGYDTDSRKAEDIYNACKLIARDFNRVFTSAQRAMLADMLKDY